MSSEEEDELNQQAFRRLESAIKRDYPYGRFVAIDGGQIIADAGTYRELENLLVSMGNHRQEVLVVEAGVDNSGYVDIL